MDDLKNIIESLLFVADEPLTVDRFKKIITGAESREVRDALEELTADYETRQGGFYLGEVAGGYQIRSRPEYKEWIKRMLQPKPLRLSKAALETLAIIAYKQPVIRSDVEHIRGVDCGGVLRVLLERKFIRVLGRREIPGRPLIYATTKRFLEVFDLKNLKDLPTPKEIEEFGR
jgi:segregation and condensation protein B